MFSDTKLNQWKKKTNNNTYLVVNRIESQALNDKEKRIFFFVIEQANVSHFLLSTYI